jgi:hypothetical protein
MILLKSSQVYPLRLEKLDIAITQFEILNGHEDHSQRQRTTNTHQDSGEFRDRNFIPDIRSKVAGIGKLEISYAGKEAVLKLLLVE